MRRVIASDNSCLFNAVGYVMERSRDRAAALRHAPHPLACTLKIQAPIPNSAKYRLERNHADCYVWRVPQCIAGMRQAFEPMITLRNAGKVLLEGPVNAQDSQGRALNQD